MAHSRLPAVCLSLASLAMASSPLSAAQMPAPSAPQAAPYAIGFDADSLNVQNHRYWRHRHYHRGPSAGDVIAGVAVIGVIAAIASAASKSNRDRRYREPRYRESESRYRGSDYRRDYRGSRSSGSPRGLDGAVEMCRAEVERNVRIDQIDEARRNGEGWQVSGVLFNGDRFSCRLGSDGRIEGIDYGRGYSARSDNRGQDNQWSDERYRAAWQRHDNGTSAAPLPAYPGGPIDGDLPAEGARGG